MSNIGGFDRVLRIVISLALISMLYFTGQSLWIWVVAAVGAVLVLTALIGFCPLYRVLGLHTNRTAS
jgi:hypothetical protein